MQNFSIFTTGELFDANTVTHGVLFLVCTNQKAQLWNNFDT